MPLAVLGSDDMGGFFKTVEDVKAAMGLSLRGAARRSNLNDSRIQGPADPPDRQTRQTWRSRI